MRDIEALVKEMTVEEKCSLLSGLDMWHGAVARRIANKRFVHSLFFVAPLYLI